MSELLRWVSVPFDHPWATTLMLFPLVAWLAQQFGPRLAAGSWWVASESCQTLLAIPAVAARFWLPVPGGLAALYLLCRAWSIQPGRRARDRNPLPRRSLPSTPAVIDSVEIRPVTQVGSGRTTSTPCPDISSRGQRCPRADAAKQAAPPVTQFFPHGSGHFEGTLILWTKSDFSLMEAIERRTAKLPRFPVADDIPVPTSRCTATSGTTSAQRC